jgi:hypothetical protein
VNNLSQRREAAKKACLLVLAGLPIYPPPRAGYLLLNTLF